jgi:hypothetical protein
MVFMRAVFSQEANREASDLIWRKTNFFGGDGLLSRRVSDLSKECAMGWFELTKDGPK